MVARHHHLSSSELAVSIAASLPFCPIIGWWSLLFFVEVVPQSVGGNRLHYYHLGIRGRLRSWLSPCASTSMLGSPAPTAAEAVAVVQGCNLGWWKGSLNSRFSCLENKGIKANTPYHPLACTSPTALRTRLLTWGSRVSIPPHSKQGIVGLWLMHFT